MAPFGRREFSGNAVPTTITGSITNSDLTINIAVATGWPTGATGPFIVTLDQGLSTEEKVEIATRSGLVLTATPTGRGHDNTAAAAHSSGAKIEHTLAARDLAEANQHIADTTLDNHGQYLNTTRHAATVHAIDTSQIVDGSVTSAKLEAAQRHMPGDFKWSMQTADHTGWLKMDGRNTLSRTTYAALFAIVGTSMGAGDGSTTFGIGSVAKRIIMGQAASGVGSTLGGTGGTADAVVVTHSHVVNDHTHTASTTGGPNLSHRHYCDLPDVGDHRHGINGDTGIRYVASSPGGVDKLSSSGTGGTQTPVTISQPDPAGGHNHDGYTDFQLGSHEHNVATGGASNRGTDTGGGVAGTDQNLPPFLVMNGFIHI